jgi:UDP-2,3-diacylglucosamine pyrophosphatase LpxH
MSTETVLFVGDLHVGGHCGIYSPERLPQVPRFVGPRYLFDCWLHLQRALPPKIDLLVLTGDLIEGTNRKGEAVGLFTSKLSEQVEAAIELLRPLAARSAQIVRVYGTPYHDSHHDPLSALDHALGVSLTRQVIDLDLGEPGAPRVLNIAHHPSGGAVLYQGTKLDREQRLAALAASARKVPGVRWIVRGHLHNFAHQRNAEREVVLLPCWKLIDAHGSKGNYFGWQPDLGAVLMEREPREPSGYRFVPFLYDPPMSRVFSPGALNEPLETA